MTQTAIAKKPDLTIKSTILRSEKANKGLEATPAANQHQMNRLIGYMPDGTKVVISHRPGKGGMDFNKIVGGKVYAIAADGLSPVFEKDKDNKPTKVQKAENGLPLYSSSGFYLLSSKEYPALSIFEAYTHMRKNGDQALLITPEQMAAKETTVVDSELDLDLLLETWGEKLSDAHNLVARYDTNTNSRRRRGIDQSKGEAAENEEAYAGVEFTELAVSKKDGNPLICYVIQVAEEKPVPGIILREADIEDPDTGLKVPEYLTNTDAIARFMGGKSYAFLMAAIAAKKQVKVTFVEGHLMRTSVSFRRKVINVQAAPKDQPAYGDAVYINAALNSWVKGIVNVMHSQHPNFPQKDYDAHHYVVACRQAEIAMNKKEGGGWTPPEAVTYSIAALLLA